jgi:hypothetical protein
MHDKNYLVFIWNSNWTGILYFHLHCLVTLVASRAQLILGRVAAELAWGECHLVSSSSEPVLQLLLLPAVVVVDKGRGWGCTSVVECVLSICEALRSIPNPHKKWNKALNIWGLKIASNPPSKPRRLIICFCYGCYCETCRALRVSLHE